MKLTVLLAIAALSGGCMSASKTDANGANDVDTAKMALIEQHALRMGVQVFWIHPPMKVARQSGG